jgi:hypothetical protein
MVYMPLTDCRKNNACLITQRSVILSETPQSSRRSGQEAKRSPAAEKASDRGILINLFSDSLQKIMEPPGRAALEY